MNEKRETLFEDRTHCHADYIHAGHASQDTTAAVGVLKRVHLGDERFVYSIPSFTNLTPPQAFPQVLLHHCSTHMQEPELL